MRREEMRRRRMMMMKTSQRYKRRRSPPLLAPRPLVELHRRGRYTLGSSLGVGGVGCGHRYRPNR
jgi:hypothetical protein